MATTTPRWVVALATAIAAGQPLLPAAPSAAVLPAMSPAMAAMLPGATSEAHAGKFTHTYTAWATMMHRQSQIHSHFLPLFQSQ